MKIAVFGAAGFIGSNFVTKLKSEDVDFIATDIAPNTAHSDINYVQADILDPESVKKVVKDCDVAVHLAASPLRTSIENPKLNAKINIEGTLNILDACRECKISKIVFSSASSVIGEVKYNPVDENHPTTPKTPYAVAKKTIEDYLRVYHALFGINYIIFRFFNIYGPRQWPSSGGLMPVMYSRLSRGENFTIFGDGSATRDYVYVEDVSNFLLRACEKDVKNEIVNLGTGKGSTILDILSLSSRILGVKPKIIYKPKRPGEIENFVADTTKLKKLFKHRPTTDLEEGLKKTFEWLKSVNA